MLEISQLSESASPSATLRATTHNRTPGVGGTDMEPGSYNSSVCYFISDTGTSSRSLRPVLPSSYFLWSSQEHW